MLGCDDCQISEEQFHDMRHQGPFYEEIKKPAWKLGHG